MRETTFLKQNEQKWKEFEEILRNPGRQISPDVLADLFVELTDDLAYARTHYPDSQTVTYLNSLAATVHQAIYRNKKQKPQRFLRFWRYEVPLTMSKSFGNLGLAFGIFLIAAIIGFFSSQRDENFLRLIVGDSYVNMTKRNIENNQPMAVYGNQGESDTFFMVMVNNIRVSFTVFIAGLLFSAGAAYMLFYNGLMLGAFHGFFFKYDLVHNTNVFWESMYTVYVHGTLEISAIIIAGAAGFALGNSLLFPGTHSRLVSLKAGAKKGLKIIAGLVPVFIVAGFLEGFVTRHSHVAPAMAITIIILSAMFILYYFIIYPLILQDQELKTDG